LLHLYPPVMRKRWLHFGKILTRLGVTDFQVFWLILRLLPGLLAACSKPPSRDNYCKAPCLMMKQRSRQGWELNQDGAIMPP